MASSLGIPPLNYSTALAFATCSACPRSFAVVTMKEYKISVAHTIVVDFRLEVYVYFKYRNRKGIAISKPFSNKYLHYSSSLFRLSTLLLLTLLTTRLFTRLANTYNIISFLFPNHISFLFCSSLLMRWCRIFTRCRSCSSSR